MLAAERARALYGRAFHELVRQVLSCHVVGVVSVRLLLGVTRWQLHSMPERPHSFKRLWCAGLKARHLTWHLLT